MRTGSGILYFLYKTASSSTAVTRVSHALLFNIGVRLCATNAAAVESGTSTARYLNQSQILKKYGRKGDDARVLAMRNTTSFPVGVIEAMLEGTASRIASLICDNEYDQCIN
jgi:hypothetical protein